MDEGSPAAITWESGSGVYTGSSCVMHRNVINRDDKTGSPQHIHYVSSSRYRKIETCLRLVNVHSGAEAIVKYQLRKAVGVEQRKKEKKKRANNDISRSEVNNFLKTLREENMSVHVWIKLHYQRDEKGISSSTSKQARLQRFCLTSDQIWRESGLKM